MSYARASDGARIHYEAFGRRDLPAVLMIQGLGADKHGWDMQRYTLARHYRVIAFDNRGAAGDGGGDQLGVDDAGVARVARALGRDDHQLPGAQRAADLFRFVEQPTEALQQRTEGDDVGTATESHRPTDLLAQRPCRVDGAEREVSRVGHQQCTVALRQVLLATDADIPADRRRRREQLDEVGVAAPLIDGICRVPRAGESDHGLHRHAAFLAGIRTIASHSNSRSITSCVVT